jgi:hypothetical protein
MNKKLVISVLMLVFFIVTFTVSAQTPFVGNIAVEDDKDEGGVSTITMTQATETIDGKQVTTYTFRGENKLEKYPYAYVNINFEPDAATLKALQTGGGIQFKATGDGTPWSFMINQGNVRDYCYHRTTFNVGAAATTISKKLTDFRQPSWGVRVLFNAARLTGFQIAKDDEQLGPFQIKIWDVEILPR